MRNFELPAAAALIRTVVEFIRTPGPGDIRLYSNDYLAIADHPRILRAHVDARLGCKDSAWMSAVFFGAECATRALERRLASFLSTEEALVGQSGYCVNVGLIQGIAAPNEVVHIDNFAHASLWDGIRLAGARPARFAHNDLASLARSIQRHGPGLVAVDSVYSQDGSVCPLAELVALARGHGCEVIVDESHALGTHGPKGAGLVVELGLTDEVVGRTASLAKAFVGRAGMIAGPADLLERVKYTSRPAIFSSAVMDHDIATLAAVLDIVQEESWRLAAVRENAVYFRGRLADEGFTTASQSQIVSIVCGRPETTAAFNKELQRQGVFGSGFCAPATRYDGALIRFSVNAATTRDELDRVAKACRRAVALIREPITAYRGASE